jgi:O-antigen/teichoic acid export membrane protein
LRSSNEPYWFRFVPLVFRSRLSGRQNLLAVLHNSGWLILDKVMRGLLVLLVGAWVARYLGPQQFGELSYVLAYLTLFQSLAYLGLDGVVVRDIARLAHGAEPAEKKAQKIGELLGTVFSVRLLAGFTCWVIAVGGMWCFSTSHNAMLVALAGGSLIFQAADSVDLWFQSQSQSRRAVVAKLMAYVVSNGLRVIFILSEMPLVWFAAALSVEFVLSAIALFISYRRFSCGAKWRTDFLQTGKLLVAESYLFAAAGLCNLLSNKIDQIVLKQYMGDAALGLYSVFLPIIAICYSIPNMIAVSALPHFSRLHKENHSEFKKKLAHFFTFNYLLSLTLVGFIFVFSKQIIYVLFGAAYIESEIPMLVYSLTAITTTSWTAQWAWMYNKKKGGQQLRQTFLGAVLTTGFSLALVPAFGVVGASAAIVLSQLGAFVLFNYFVDKDLFYLQFCRVRKDAYA